jgi:hypothetical protein
MKKRLLLPALVFAAASSVRATNISIIDFAGQVSNVVQTEAGALLPNGGALIRIGYFNAAAQGASWLLDLQSEDVGRINSAMGAFVPLGENAARPDLGSIPAANAAPRFTQRTINNVVEQGRLAGQIANITPVVGAPNSLNGGGVPAGSRIALVVYSDLDSVLNLGEEFGVFSADIWLMPADGGLNLQLNSTNVDVAAEVFRGSIGSLRLDRIVPEPSTFLTLSGLAGLMALRRRR